MTKRTLFLCFTLILFVALAGAVHARSDPPPPEPGNGLIYVPLPTQDDLARFERTGLPVYARLSGRDGEYVLTGADPANDVLAAARLSARILDDDTAAAPYYLVYPMPGRLDLDWSAYGRVLLDDGVRLLMRASPQDAARLAEAGAELRALTFDPKPLRPASPARVYPDVIIPDPFVQSMIDQVSSTDVYRYTGDLSGEWSVYVGGTPYTITTRHTYSGEPLQKATQFVGEHMANLGLDVEYHEWNASYPPNVIGELTGTLYPDEIVIICAHLDDMPSGPLAPGADDNASGSVGVLIAADILSQYDWTYTLRFAIWTGEEQGLHGSAAYAQRAYNSGENIAGVLNLDMIAWNTPLSSPDIDVHADSSIPATLDLAHLFADVVDAYGMDLIPQVVPNGTGASDHSSFWNYGYTAVLGIEDNSDFNPYYHTTNDLLSILDIPYFTDFVRASVGTFAHMGSPLKETGYLSGTVSSLVTGDPIAGATVEALDPNQTWTATTGGGGAYQLEVAFGDYTVMAVAPGYMPTTTTGIMVRANQTTTLDLTLVVTPTFILSGHVRDALTSSPVSATVSLPGAAVTPRQTDPATGLYVLTATVPPGSYVLRTEVARYVTYDRVITINDDRVEDFDMERICLLVVDDDGGIGGYETYYTGALDRMGYSYDVTASTPDIETLSHYQGVVWLTGYVSNATLTASDQANLAAYLDGGGKLFLSGQDVGLDIGSSSFYADYLHADYHSDDVNVYTLSGLDVFSGMDVTISGGSGANNQLRPSDVEPVNGGVAVYDYPAPHLYGGVAYSGTYRTVYFSFGYEAINKQADRDDVMSATLAYLGVTCSACPPVSGIGFAHAPSEPWVGDEVVFTASATGGTAELPVTYAWDFGDESGVWDGNPITHTFPLSIIAQTYTVTLTVVNGCSSEEEIAKSITVLPRIVYLPLVVRDYD